MNLDATVPWNESGGDFDKTPVVISPAGKAGEIERHDITSAINAIIKGDKPNNGFILTPATSENLQIQMQDHIYYSSEATEVSKRPALVLDDGIDAIISNKAIISQNSMVQQSAGNVCVRSEKKNFTVTVVDMLGREHYRLQSVQNEVSFPEGELGKGYFILYVDYANFSEVIPLLIR